MTVLKEEAKKAEELQVEVMERTAAWKKISEKKHEMMLGALNTSVGYPRRNPATGQRLQGRQDRSLRC